MTGSRLSAWEAEIARVVDEKGGAIGIGREIRCYAETTSTMDCARNLAADVPSGGLGLVVAREQTAGRGRQGRTWIATRGALYATIVWRPRIAIEQLAGLSLAVGCSIRRALLAWSPEVRLKWPNDLLDSKRRKLAGILIESSSRSREAVVLIGIGVNLGEVSEELPNAVGLMDLGAPSLAVPVVAGKFFAAIAADLERFAADGFGGFREEWLAAAEGLGKTIAVDTGNAVVRGKFLDIDCDGALIMEREGERTRVSAGHVLDSV